MGKCVVWLWRLWLGLWIWWIWLWPRIPWILRWIPIQIWLWILWPKKEVRLSRTRSRSQPRCLVWIPRIWWILWWLLWPRLWLPIWWIRLWILWPKKSDPLRLKQNQKLMLVPMLGMDMEVTDTDIHTDTDTDVTMDTVVMATHMDTTDTTVKCHAIETVPAKTTLPSSL